MIHEDVVSLGSSLASSALQGSAQTRKPFKQMATGTAANKQESARSVKQDLPDPLEQQQDSDGGLFEHPNFYLKNGDKLARKRSAPRIVDEQDEKASLLTAISMYFRNWLMEMGYSKLFENNQRLKKQHIYGSPNWSRCKNLLLIISSPTYKFGVWSFTLCLESGLKTGTMHHFVERAMAEGTGIVVIQPKKIKEGSVVQSERQMVSHAWNQIQSEVAATNVSVIAYLDAGGLAKEVLYDDFNLEEPRRKLQGILMVEGTETVHAATDTEEALAFFRQRAVNWVGSSAPAGAPLPRGEELLNCKCISVGRQAKRSLTAAYSIEPAMPSMFRFLRFVELAMKDPGVSMGGLSEDFLRQEQQWHGIDSSGRPKSGRPRRQAAPTQQSSDSSAEPTKPDAILIPPLNVNTSRRTPGGSPPPTEDLPAHTNPRSRQCSTNTQDPVPPPGSAPRSGRPGSARMGFDRHASMPSGLSKNDLSKNAKATPASNALFGGMKQWFSGSRSRQNSKLPAATPRKQSVEDGENDDGFGESPGPNNGMGGGIGASLRSMFGGTAASPAREDSGPPEETVDQPESVGPDDFSFLRVVGKGAFGKVMLVRKEGGRHTGRIFAMKVLRKSLIAEKGQIEHTKIEFRIFCAIRHPFICRLRYAFQNDEKLYLVTDYYCGGSLFYHLRKAQRFGEDRARFYMAEILSALEHLHKNQIIYRDLKLENVIMDQEGHLAITDFGLSKMGCEDAQTFCGTAEYMAPELVKGQTYTGAVDWWSFGIMVYEMMAGRTPFYDKNRKAMFQKIMRAAPDFPDHFSSAACSVVRKFLVLNPSARLGVGAEGPDAIKQHRFFSCIDFEALDARQLRPPFAPAVEHDEVKYVPRTYLEMEAKDSTDEQSRAKAALLHKNEFHEYTYHGTPQPPADRKKL